jgi:hypothetical protein
LLLGTVPRRDRHVALLVAKIFPHGVGATPGPDGGTCNSRMGAMSRDELITAGTFVLMVTGWALGSKLNLNGTSVAFLGFASAADRRHHARRHREAGRHAGYVSGSRFSSR